MEHEWLIIKKPLEATGPMDPIDPCSTLGVKIKEEKGYRGAYAIIESPMTTNDENYIIEILQRNAIPLKEGTIPIPLFKW